MMCVTLFFHSQAVELRLDGQSKDLNIVNCHCVCANRDTGIA
jgi:hypothetical protein